VSKLGGQATVHRIGFLSLVPAETVRVEREAFRQGLYELGYVEDRDIIVEERYADGKVELIPDLTSELIQRQVRLIVVAPSSVARGVRQVTQTVPIVVAYGDPVAQELVVSLAQPGGNVTGLSASTTELSAKRLQLLKDALPGISRVAILAGGGIGTDQWVSETEAAARALGLRLQILVIRDPSEFESAFTAMSAEHADALVVTPGPILRAASRPIAELATKRRLPTMFESRPYATAGGLMAYGPNLPDLARRSAAYVDKILKGAKPGDLPIELPTKFDFIINLRTAQALGLTIPPSVLAQATEVIQ